jgi:O-antigen/teichoic acid export membrane protein
MLAKNVIRQFITQIIGLVSGLATSIITARILGPEGRGDFSLLLNTSGFVSLILGFSFSVSIVHVISSERMPVRNTVNTFTLLVLLLCLVCILVLWFFPFHLYAFLVPRDFEQKKIFYLCVLIALFVIGLFNSLYTAFLSGKRLFWEQQKVNLVFACYSIVAYGLLYYFKTDLGLTFDSFMLFYLSSLLFPVIGFYWMYFRHARPAWSFSFLNKEQLRYVLGYSMLAYLCNVFQFLSNRMDFWFIEHFKGSRDLGYYSLSVNLAQMLWVLPQAISMILLSYSGAQTREKAIENTNALSRMAVFVVGSASVLLLFIIDYIIPFLYGQDYFASAFLFKLLLAGIVPFSITTILASYFSGRGKMRINLYTSLLSFMICLAGDLALIPLYGNTGAAIATIISYAFSTFFITFVYIRREKVKWNDLIVLKRSDVDAVRARLGKGKK